MSAWGALGPGTRVLALVAGGAGVAGGGYLVWQSTRPAAVVVPAASVLQAPVVPQLTATATVDTTADAATVPDATSAAAPERGLPGIDTWRVAPDGAALVAGLATPMAKVAVLVDGVQIADGEALASGEFVMQFTLAPNPAPSLMTLSMTEPGKPEVISEEMVALGPISGPDAAQPTPDAEVAAGDEGLTDPDTALSAAAPDALLLTEGGAVVLQDNTPAGPALMSQVMIDTITYTPSGAVQVGGRGTPGATVRIYLDNAEVAALPVPDRGLWLAILGDTPPGIYTLRADQLDAGGKVTSRFETPFQRETLEALASAVEPPVVAGTAAALAVAPAPDLLAKAGPDPVPEPAVAVAEPEPQAPAAQLAVPAEAASETAPPVSVTVQPGFTLWGIAQDSLGDGVLYVQVFEANRDKIKNPDLIYPGQVLSVPATP